MLEQPWPPAAPGPQQPRDAHRQHWANDAHRRPPVAGGGTPSSAGAWGGGAAREPAVRRADRARWTDGDGAGRVGAERGVPGPDGPDGVGRVHDGDGWRRPSGARWVPAEAWIPDPTPAPEQRWTPEQDWLAAFADRREAPVAAPVVPRRRVGRRVAAGAVALGLVVAVLTALAALF